MNVSGLLHHPLVERVGWTLLHFLWQGAVIGLFAVLMMIVLKRWSPQVRYAALLALLGLCVANPVATFAWLTLSEPRVTATAQRLERSVEPTIPPAKPASHPAEAPIAGSGVAPSVGQLETVGWTRPWPRYVQLSRTAGNFVPWLAVGWCCGVMLLTVRMLGGWWSLRQCLVHYVQPLGERWLPVVTELAAALQVRRAVNWVESSAPSVPLTVGWLRPTVIVPVSVLSGLSPAAVQCLLAHELAHIRRHDYLVNLLQCVIEVLLFYHPVVWWLSRRIRHERETICDDMAVNVTGDRIVYSRALLSVAELAQRPPNLAVAAGGGELKERVQRLLGAPASVRLAPGMAVICVLLVLGGIGLLLVSSQNGNRAAPPDSDSATNAAAAVEHFGDGKFRLPPVSGHIVDSRGQPIAGARVFVRESVRGYTSRRFPAKSSDLAMAVTGADGRFSFPEVPVDEDGRRVDVVAVADGYALAWRHLPGGVPQKDVRLVLQPESQVSGRIVDESGTPISEATVRLKYVMSIRHITQADLEEGRWPRSDDAQFVSLRGFRAPPSVQSDKEGRFILSGLPAGRGVYLEIAHPRHVLKDAYAATVEAIDPANASRTKRDVQTGEMKVPLRRGRRLHVQVVYDDTGEPAVGARYPDVLNSITTPPTFEVDNRGRFEVAHLDRPEVDLYVYPPDVSDYLGTMERVEFPDDEYEKSLTVRLSRGAVITGQVVDEVTGEGVAGVPLWAIAPPQPLVEGRMTISNQPVSSRVDGTFRVVCVPGEVTLAVHGSVPGYLTSVGNGSVQQLASIQTPVTATLDALVEGITIELPPASVVNGTVYDVEGAPASGVAITGRVMLRVDERGTSYYRPLNEVTDENGRFLLDELHPAWGPDKAARPIEVLFRDRSRNLGRLVLIEPPTEDDPRERQLDVHLQPLGTLAGRFINADTGEPISGVRVALYKQDADPTAGTWHPVSPELRSRPDGRFELDGAFGGVGHYISVTDGRFRRLNDLDTRYVGKYGERHDVGDVELFPLQPPDEQQLPAIAAPSVEGLAPEAAFELLTERYTADFAAYQQMLENAATERERAHVVERREPTPVYAEALRKLAEDNSGSDVELRSLIWILNCPIIIGGTEEKVRPLKPPIAERLLEAFADRQELAECVQGLLIYPFGKMNPKERAIAAAERLLENNPHREVQGRACYELAQRLAFDHWADPSPRERELAIEHLQRVVDEYADTRHWRSGTLGEAAERDLFELQNLVVGATAPEISGTDLDGKAMSLSDFRGKVVILDFWGSWCGPCISALPTLEAVAEEFGDRVVVLGVMSDPPQAAAEAVAKHDVSFRNWVDGRRGSIVKQWNIDSRPATFVLDHQGVIRHTNLEADRLQDAVWQLLQK